MVMKTTATMVMMMFSTVFSVTIKRDHRYRFEPQNQPHAQPLGTKRSHHHHQQFHCSRQTPITILSVPLPRDERARYDDGTKRSRPSTSRARCTAQREQLGTCHSQAGLLLGPSELGTLLRWAQTAEAEGIHPPEILQGYE
jgi:hypothetical protein